MKRDAYNSAIVTTSPGPSIDHLWTVRKGDQIVRAELFQHGECQVRFFSDGYWFAAQSFASRDHAVRYAGLFERDLVRAGWVNPKATG
jgi:hypothetical protein